jgi:hypothetical protein
MARILTLILGAFVLSGCTMFEAEPSTAATMLPQLSADRAAAVPEGARVEIERRFASADTRATTTGVVLKSSPEGLALANCTVAGMRMEGVPIANKVPYASRLFKATGTPDEQLPVLWVPLDQISSVRVIEPPSKDYVSPAIQIETANTVRRGVDFDFNAPAAEESAVVEEPAVANDQESDSFASAKVSTPVDAGTVR